MDLIKKYFHPINLMRISGLTLVLLGLIVIGGWFLHLTILIQLHPNFAPMQFNTALCFVVVGLIMILIVADHKKICCALSFILLIFSVMTLSEYIFNVSLGIDSIINSYIVNPLAPYPGRMSVLTSVNFMLISVMTLLHFLLLTKKYKTASIFVLIISVLVIGASSLLGYLTEGFKFFSWLRFNQMALHTSAGFVVAGGALLFFQFAIQYQERRNFAAWIVLFLCVLTTVFAYSYSKMLLHDKERAYFDREVDNIKYQIIKKLNEYETVVKSGQALFASSQNVERSEWKVFNNEFQLEKNYPGFFAFGYVHEVAGDELSQYEKEMQVENQSYKIWPKIESDNHLIIKYVEPQEKNIDLLGYDITSNPSALEAAMASLNREKIIMSGKLEILPNHKQENIIFYFMPIFKHPHDLSKENGKELLGFVFGGVDLQKMIISFKNDLNRNINFEIYEENKIGSTDVLYDSDEESVLQKNNFKRVDKIEVSGKVWSVNFESLPSFKTPVGRSLSTAFLIMGLTISVTLFGFVNSLAQTTTKATAIAHKMTYDLKIREDQLEKAMLVKAEFIATVSHELRTPLTIIKTALEIVLKGMDGEVNEKQSHHLEMAKRNVDRLARLINDVLDFQKLEAGKMELSIKPVQINDVINEVVEMYSAVAANKGLVLNHSLSKDLPLVACDHDKIVQVLVNLVNNAVKFTDKGAITVSSQLLNHKIRISVKDDGPGVSAVDKEKLFKSFSQLEHAGARKVGGTGLGLAICKKIIELHHGNIGVESEAGKGSTFYFELPCSTV